MTTKAIADASADTTLLISEISRLPRGAEITYADHFTRWMGRQIHNRRDLPTFPTVVKRLRADYGIVLSAIVGVGYKLLTDEQTLKDDHQIRRATRCASRRKKELATVDTGKLNDQQRLDYVGKVTQAHLVEETSRDKSLKKLVAAANGSTVPLALGHALEALRRNL